MTDWYIRIIGRRKEEVDKHLLVQAVLAMARLLEKRQRAEERPVVSDVAAERAKDAP